MNCWPVHQAKTWLTDHSGEQCAERQEGTRLVAGDVELRPFLHVDGLQTGPRIPVPDLHQCQQRDQQARDEEPDAVDRVRDRDRLEASQDRVERAQRSHTPDEQPNHLHLAQAERLLQAEQAVDAGGPGQQDNGQDREHVREQEHGRSDYAGGPVVAGRKVLRNRREAHAQVARQEIERGCDHRDRSGCFPSGNGDGVVEGVTVQTDQVLGRKVGEHQRTRNDPGRQATASKEVRVPSRHPVTSGVDIGNHRDQQREAQERNSSHKHGGILAEGINCKRSEIPLDPMSPARAWRDEANEPIDGQQPQR